MPPKRRYKSKPLVYKLQVTLCASESRCAKDFERLAQLGFISSTASMLMTAFSFRLVEQTHASWRVTPRALIGYADGLKEYYSRCGWVRGHYTGHPWDKDLRKQRDRRVPRSRNKRAGQRGPSRRHRRFVPTRVPRASGQRDLISCSFDRSKFRNLWHVGNHGHRPPPANAPNPAAARAYAATLRYRTSIHPAVLRQGYDVRDPQSPTYQRPAFEWDPRWVSLTKLRRDMDKFYGRPDSSPDLDAAAPDSANTAPIWIALQGLVRLQPQYLAYQTADKKGNLLSFGIQTPEMRAWAVDDQSFAQEMGRGGIPTDAHNSFFTDGLILITSVVLHPLLERWVPILHSIGRSEDSEIYWAHFDHIYQLADRTGKSTIDALRDFKLVLDFSAAQGSSFKHAFADWYVRRQVSVKGSDNVTVEGRVELRQEGLNLAQEQMICCPQHYKASVNRHSTLRFLRNDTGADTKPLQDLQHEFATMAWSLTKARTPRAAAAIAESITKRWSMLRHWGTFWTLPRILLMIDRALSKMTPEERRLYPTTTNAVESAHNCLLHASASNNNKPAKGVHRVLDSVQFFIGLQVVAKTGNFMGSRLRSKGNDEDEKKQVTAAARAVEKRKQVPRSYVPSGRPLDTFEAENRRPISHKAFMDKALLDSDDDNITIVEVAVNAEYQNSPPLELVNDIVVEAAAEVERSSAPLENAGIPDPPSTNTTGRGGA